MSGISRMTLEDRMASTEDLRTLEVTVRTEEGSISLTTEDGRTIWVDLCEGRIRSTHANADRDAALEVWIPQTGEVEIDRQDYDAEAPEPYTAPGP